jgi:hypothetical protein
VRSFDPDSATGDSDWEYRSPAGNLAALRREIVRRYQGKPIEEVLRGELVERDHGNCYRIATELRGALGRWQRDQALADLLTSTCLLRGVRDRTGRKLAGDGFRTLADLEEHPRFGTESSLPKCSAGACPSPTRCACDSPACTTTPTSCSSTSRRWDCSPDSRLSSPACAG